MKKLIDYFDEQIKQSNEEMLPNWSVKTLQLNVLKLKNQQIFQKFFTEYTQWNK